MYFCVYFLHACFVPVFSHVICVQCGGLTRKKHTCNAAMPMTCSVKQTKNNMYLSIDNTSTENPIFFSRMKEKGTSDLKW